VATILVAVQQVPHTVAVVPLNLTVSAVDPKFVPVIVTEFPTTPELDERLVIAGAGTTLNVLPLLSTPLACTITLPVVAPMGTIATILLAPQLVIVVAVVPLNFSVLEPWGEPKLAPVIVTEAPIAPEVIERLEILGVGDTVKGLPPLATPLTVTTTLPLVAPVGTTTTILVAAQVG
jgi:hypothetical protein